MYSRIDFRELVRDLFALYKTRIWMQQVDHSFIPDERASRALATGEYVPSLAAVDNMDPLTPPADDRQSPLTLMRRDRERQQMFTPHVVDPAPSLFHSHPVLTKVEPTPDNPYGIGFERPFGMGMAEPRSRTNSGSVNGNAGSEKEDKVGASITDIKKFWG